jgi:hypothetical protein
METLEETRVERLNAPTGQCQLWTTTPLSDFTWAAHGVERRLGSAPLDITYEADKRGKLGHD